MANGYKTGDYLGQFLAQLPQIYRAKQNAQLQRERFEYMKDEGIKDDVYRGQVLTANQERNQLARDQFKQRQTQNTQDEAYRTAVLDNATKTQDYNEFNQQYDALTGNKEGQEMLLKSKFKGNQQMIDSIDENRDIKESMQGQVYALDALPPEQRLLQARKLLSSPHLTNDLYKTLTEITKGGKEELQFTLDELKGTEAAIEYSQLVTQLEDPQSYAPRKVGQTTLSQGELISFQNTIVNKLAEVRKSGLAEYKTGYGEYPTYDNVDIEAVNDEELDALIADFSAPFTERYPFSLSDNTNMVSSESPEIQTATFGKPTTTTPTSSQDTTTTTPTPVALPAKETQEEETQATSAYTGTDANKKAEVDFFFGLLKNGEISRKRFMEGITKANVNPQSINLKMIYQQKGKPEKKELSPNKKRSIKVLLNRINTVSERNFKNPGDKAEKINKIKEDILAIDPNYKFQT
tara:strand:- start:18 stop:1409 length:1392 start_codon:yes stop_codon:yes gene_type:complete